MVEIVFILESFFLSAALSCNYEVDMSLVHYFVKFDSVYNSLYEAFSSMNDAYKVKTVQADTMGGSARRV